VSASTPALRAVLLAAGALAAAAGPAAAADSPKAYARWWVETYGVIEPTEQPLVDRARDVFVRLRAVADTSAGISPRLLVVRFSEPLAYAIPDGTVVLSSAGLALAYGGVTPAIGDGRLALVLGHELAHGAKEDFYLFFAAGPRGLTLRRPAGATLDQEQKADVVGLVYALQAGYDIDEVLPQAQRFLERWAGSHRGATSTHPTPRTRQRVLSSRLKAVRDSLDLFRFGLRLYQLGRHADAIDLLEAFRPLLPSREVLGAIALCHYQLALQALAECGDETALRFRLPTRLDTETLARRRTMRGSMPCAESEAFRSHAREAADQLRLALKQDPAHLPTYVNLSSLYILMGEEAQAMDVADRGLKRTADRALRLNQSLARFAYGEATRIEGLADEALEQMRALADEAPADPVAAYNLAAMQSEKTRPAQAREGWERFLRLEPDGPYAAVARTRLQLAPLPARSPAAPPASPLALGDVRPSAPVLRGLQRLALSTSNAKAAVYHGDGLAALELNGGLEVVEEELVPALPLATVAERWGRPRDRIETTLGTTLVFDGFALDLVGDLAVRRAYFTP